MVRAYKKIILLDFGIGINCDTGIKNDKFPENEMNKIKYLYIVINCNTQDVSQGEV